MQNRFQPPEPYRHINNEEDIVQICPIPANMRIIAQYDGNPERGEEPFDEPVVALAVYRNGTVGYISHSVDGILDGGGWVIEYRHVWEADIAEQSGVAQDAGTRESEIEAAARHLLYQLEKTGVYIPGVDEGNWQGFEGLSFSRIEKALKK